MASFALCTRTLCCVGVDTVALHTDCASLSTFATRCHRVSGVGWTHSVFSGVLGPLQPAAQGEGVASAVSWK